MLEAAAGENGYEAGDDFTRYKKGGDNRTDRRVNSLQSTQASIKTTLLNSADSGLKQHHNHSQTHSPVVLRGMCI